MKIQWNLPITMVAYRSYFELTEGEMWVMREKFIVIRWPYCNNLQVSRAGTSNYIPQYLWGVITCPCPWYLLPAHKSTYNCWPCMPTAMVTAELGVYPHLGWRPCCDGHASQRLQPLLRFGTDAWRGALRHKVLQLVMVAHMLQWLHRQ